MKRIGIIGGLGPLATVKFMEILADKLTNLSEEIEMVVINDPTTPDRTSYILDNNKANPLDNILEMVRSLHRFDVSVIVMPCNTASYFYKAIIENSSIPFINIVEETVEYVEEHKIKKVGLLATDGTVKSGIYADLFNKKGIECIVPVPSDQNIIMNIIYERIKKGKAVDLNLFYKVINNLKKKGCECIILGCTELSALNKIYDLPDDNLIDAMEILAEDTLMKLGITHR